MPFSSPCDKGKKVHTFYKVKGLRSCEKTFGNCGVDFAKYYRYWIQSKALQLCKGLMIHSSCISWEIQPGAGSVCFIPHLGPPPTYLYRRYKRKSLLYLHHPITNHTALLSNFQVLVLYLECSESSSVYPRLSLGTSAGKDVTWETGFYLPFYALSTMIKQATT